MSSVCRVVRPTVHRRFRHPGAPVVCTTASVGAVTNGSISGLLNGVTYNLAVFAKTGARSRAELVALSRAATAEWLAARRLA